MIKLRIKNKNGDVLYERDDEHYVRLNGEDFAYISDVLDDVGSDVVYVDIDCDIDDNPFMVYSYHSVMRGGKTVIENKIKSVLKEYEKQLSALPARHPAAHAASCMRENDGDDGDDGHDGYDIPKAHAASRMREVGDLDENDGYDGYDSRVGYDGHDGHDISKVHTTSRMREDDGHDENDDHDEDNGRNEDDGHDENDSHGNHDDYDGHMNLPDYDISLPDHKFEEEDILATLPGTYVGCGKHDECKRQSERKSDLEQDTEKHVRTSEDPEHTQLLKDFISYLNTYASWASLLDDLGFYDKSKDGQELIEKFYRTRAITQSIRDSYERHERNLRQPWKR